MKETYTELKKKLVLSRKKILIIGPAHPLRGGLATYNERLAHAFIEMGHECEILSFSLQYPSLLFPGKTQYSTDPKPEGIVIHSLINSINPINWITTGFAFKKKQYDLIVFRYWMSFMAPSFGTIAKLLKQHKNTRIIAITDNVIPHEKRFFDSWFTHYFLPKCDAYLTMSEAVKQQLLDLGYHKPSVYVPHPMYDMFGEPMNKEVAKAKLNLDLHTPYLLFFGFIRQYKGLMLLLETLTHPKLQQLPFKVIIAGEFYEDKQPYLDFIANHKLGDRVILKDDFIPNDEVSAYFCAADAVIQPYLNATQSGVTQIAYYYNKPMIVTNVGGLAELVPDHKVGLVCEVSADALADAVYEYYTQQFENSFSEQMKTEKLRFTWENVCKQLFKVAGYG